ncbi:MAG: L-idonate 5-dehydrogenase [Bifidobacteriaceae bacterium]|jgi:L-idonate 5-dehydrogenase|nr:L-idonate 5-dehydrogenase [Bifidobacteriaceae bacterium]
MTTATMKAVVVHGQGDLRIEERPRPTPGPGEVLLAVEWGGICGSDVAYWRHGASGTAKLRAPLVLGHEFAGRLAALGPGSQEAALAAGIGQIEPGLPVAVYPAAPIGDATLPARIAGRSNLHPQVRYYGSAAVFPHTDGGFIEYMSVPAGQLLPLPDAVDTRHGALAEPLGVAIHAVNRALAAFGPLSAGPVLVNGAGPIGAMVVAVAKRLGARHVTACDVAAAPLRIARALGADSVVNTAEAPLPEGCPLVFEASGAPAALAGVLRATAPGGVLVQVGNLPAEPVKAALGALITREITWVGSFRFVGEMSDALALLADGLDIDAVMTHSFSLDQAGSAMAVAADRTTGSSKVMLQLGGAPAPGEVASPNGARPRTGPNRTATEQERN